MDQTTSSAAAGGTVERRQALTPEAFGYLKEDGKSEGRYPFRMSIHWPRLSAVGTELPSSITIEEAKLLIHNDGDKDKCDRCGDEFQLFVARGLADLQNERLAEAIRAGTARKAPEETFGRLAPYVATWPNGQVIEWGSIVKAPLIKEGRYGLYVAGWQEPKKLCGPLFWYDQNTGRVGFNNKSCLGRTLIGLEKLRDEKGLKVGVHSYSRRAVEASIAASKAKHEANLAANRERIADDEAIVDEALDLFNIEVGAGGGRTFSKKDAPKPPTMGELPVEKVDRSDKGRAQGRRR